MLRDNRAAGSPDPDRPCSTVVPKSTQDDGVRVLTKCRGGAREKPVAARPEKVDAVARRECDCRVGVHDDVVLRGADVNGVLAEEHPRSCQPDSHPGQRTEQLGQEAPHPDVLGNDHAGGQRCFEPAYQLTQRSETSRRDGYRDKGNGRVSIGISDAMSDC